MSVTSTFNFQKSHINLGSRVTGWFLACWCGNPADSQGELLHAKVEAETMRALGTGSLSGRLRDKQFHLAEQERMKPEGQIFGNAI